MTWSEISFSLRNLPVRAFDSRAQGFSPPLARQRSSCPPPSPNLVRTHLIENHQALRDSAPCLSRAATLPKATKLELGRGAHLKTPSSANHTAAASQPTGRIAKAASWLHLSRVSPALLPPERPSHTLKSVDFVRRLKPTESHMHLDGQQYLCYCWDFLLPLRPRWMSACDGSTAGVRVSICASLEAQRVSYVSRWAALSLFLFFFLTVIPLRHGWTSAGGSKSMGLCVA